MFCGGASIAGGGGAADPIADCRRWMMACTCSLSTGSVATYWRK